MPLITLEFDNAIVQDKEATLLSQAVRDIVSEVTAIEDVFVYANTARIKIQVAPIEIFVQMAEHLVPDIDALLEDVKKRISAWKTASKFSHPINLTIIPMKWKFAIGI